MDPKTEWMFSEGYFSTGSSGAFDGRRLERELSDESQGKLLSVEEAFDDGVLDVLAPRERECFVDVIVSGDSYEVVAARYRIRLGSVKYYVRCAAQKIRQEIEKHNG